MMIPMKIHSQVVILSTYKLLSKDIIGRNQVIFEKKKILAL